MSLQSAEFEFRLKILLFCSVAIFLFLWSRLFYIQVVRGENLRSIAEANRTTLLFERAPRGLIVDRDGHVLADSRPTFVVLFTPLELNKDIFSGVLRRLSGILGEDEEKLTRRLQPSFQRSSLVRVMERASKSIAFALAEQRPNLPGVSVVTEMQRRYPNGTAASHVLGYLGQISSSEFQQLRSEGYQQDWLIGKVGLEKMYDAFLRGQHGGTRIEVDASGRSVKILDRREPLSGYQLRTTLNLKMQQAAEAALADAKKPGAVVALDPRTGEVLAYASAPAFDPNVFLYERGQVSEQGSARPEDLLTHSDLPLLNRPIQGTYPPGSIFKIVTTAAALESGRIATTDAYYCPGYYWLGGPGGKKFLCWKKEGHGRMDLFQALQNSCNVYFYQAGLKTGPDAIESMARKFGLGSATGVEFPGEKAGLIPGRGMFKGGRRHWFDGDTLNMAIGQGTILFTPLQAAHMISVMAAHGKVYRPRVVRDILQPDGNPYASSAPELIREFKLSDSTWAFLDQALANVVESGTGQASKIPGIAVGGKTGTAQNPHGKDHAWFVAYAPVGNPEIAVSVIVENGEKGSVSAAPVARKVLLAAFEGRLSEQQQKAQVSGPAETTGD